ncbi:hypothetical protein BO71DRAFT_401463 [Aspergillus ellipticus CBS 707.79]|uniref:Uncharacterized protein n=1 Tax=Aspergillus ellipticus CBS 707.79 TaxID=1448320 RepID=A0A319D1A4_9EURO|nr:hypothetical protein BO71DRAFT_401463 [Aspergillus ellipticus CBS 707.79]
MREGLHVAVGLRSQVQQPPLVFSPQRVSSSPTPRVAPGVQSGGWCEADGQSRGQAGGGCRWRGGGGETPE